MALKLIFEEKNNVKLNKFLIKEIPLIKKKDGKIFMREQE